MGCGLNDVDVWSGAHKRTVRMEWDWIALRAQVVSFMYLTCVQTADQVKVEDV